MKNQKASRRRSREDALCEYDFAKGVVGKYAKRFSKGTNLVALAPDVARVFPDSQSVNDALRVLARLRRRR